MTDKEYQKKLGQRIASLRKGKGWTQEEFSENLKVNRTDVSRIESGNINSSINKLRKIAEVLEMELGDLVSV